MRVESWGFRSSIRVDSKDSSRRFLKAMLEKDGGEVVGRGKFDLRARVMK
jgi:hypothetical protein